MVGAMPTTDNNNKEEGEEEEKEEKKEKKGRKEKKQKGGKANMSMKLRFIIIVCFQAFWTYQI